MKYRFLTSAAAVLALGAATAVYAANDYVMLELGKQEIKKSDVEAIWSGLFPAGEAPDFDTVEEPIKQNVLRGVISEYLLYDEAVKSGVNNDAELAKTIEEAKRKLTVRHFIEKKTEGLVKESDLRAEYDKMVRDTRDKEEVRARHILVKDEETAKEIKKKLDDGADFEALAKEKSADPGSKVQGGDLGYFTEERMVPEFSKAAFALKEGEVSEPVKSGFGWHIIKVEDRRKMKAPTFSDVKDELKARLSEQRLNDYVAKLVDSTDITYFGPDGKEKELTRMPTKAE